MKKLLFVLACAAALAGCVDTGSGEKIGNIVKVSKTGVFCKTNEAEIIRGGINGGTGANGSAFYFTIESDELAEKLQKAMEAQQEIKIKYRSEGFTWCRSDSQGHFLVSFDVLGNVIPTIPMTSENVPRPAAPQSRSDDVLLQILQQNQRLLEVLATQKK